MRTLIITLTLLLVCNIAYSQIFSPPQLIVDYNEIEVYHHFTADVNGDGFKDVLALRNTALNENDDNAYLVWYENDGEANFSSKQIINETINPDAIIYAADLDGDSDTDICVASPDSLGLYYLVNDGLNNFNTSITLSEDAALYTHLVDLDNDGDIDIIASFEETDEIIWYENDGMGTYTNTYVISNYLSNVNKILTGDLNGDDILDIIAHSSEDQQINWYNGATSFGYPQVLLNTGGNFAFGDEDGDGDLDIIHGATAYTLLENDGTASFTSSSVLTNIDFSEYDFKEIIMVDLDNDSNQELLVTNDGNMFKDGILYVDNDGNLDSGGAKKLSRNSDGLEKLLVDDFNNDDRIDILAYQPSTDHIICYLNKQFTTSWLGYFDEKYILEKNIKNPKTALVADLDNNGSQEIVIGSHNMVSYFSMEDSSTNFANQSIITRKSGGVIDMDSGDLNDDGKIDIITSADIHLLTTIFNNGSEWNHQYFNLGSSIQLNEYDIIFDYGFDDLGAIEVADMNDDGLLDIVFSYENIIPNYSWGTVIESLAVYYQQENGSFMGQNLSSIHKVFDNISIADFNGDGIKDVLAENYVHLNTVSDTIVAFIDEEGISHPSDINNDGHIDILFAYNSDNNSDNNSYLYGFINDGMGDFEESFLIDTYEGLSNSNAYQAIQSHDFNQDGFEDLFIGRYNALEYYQNNTNGGYEEAIIIDSTTTKTIHIADVDNDLDDDILTSAGGSNINYPSGRVVLYENQTPSFLSEINAIENCEDENSSLEISLGGESEPPYYYELLSDEVVIQSATIDTNALVLSDLALGLYDVLVVHEEDSIYFEGLEVYEITPPQFLVADTLYYCDGYNVFSNFNLGMEVYFSNIQWETQGDGYFVGGMLPNPTYYLGDADKENGSVLLSVSGEHNCGVTIHEIVLETEDFDYPNFNFSICNSEESYTIPAIDFSAESFYWSTSFSDGSFDDIYSPTPTYTFGPEDIASGDASLRLNLSYEYCGTDVVYVNISLDLNSSTDTINTLYSCNNGTSLWIGNLSLNTENTNWSTQGDGTFNSSTDDTPIYYFGEDDITNGMVTFNVTGENSCGSVEEEVNMIIGYPPYLPNELSYQVCIDETSFSLPPIETNTNNIIWVSNGDGYFDNPNSNNPSYTFGPNDLLNEAVTLDFYVDYNCYDDQVTVILELGNESLSAIADTIYYCSIEEFYQFSDFNLEIENTSWETQGDGFFDDASDENPVYYFGESDMENGIVNFSLAGENACGLFMEEEGMVLHIITTNDLPTQTNYEACTSDESFTIPLLDINTDNFSWTIFGEGYFDDPNSITPTYYFSPEDIDDGSVYFNLNLFYENCEEELKIIFIEVDDQDITIEMENEYLACYTDESIDISSLISNSDIVSWETTGDGYFDDSNIANTTYTFGPNDLNNEEVILNLLAETSTCEDKTEEVLIEFLEPITWQILSNCDETTGTITLDVEISGGLPAYDDSESYFISGDYEGETNNGILNMTFTDVTPLSTFNFTTTDANGCEENTEITVDCTNTSIEKISTSFEVIQSMNQIEILAPNMKGCQLINIIGQIATQSDRNILDISDLPSGAYLLQLSFDNQTITKKIIIH